MKVLVTGANGFIGQNLSALLMKQDFNVCKAIRTPVIEIEDIHQNDVVIVGDINANTDWSDYLINVDLVVHLAAVTHQKALSADQDLFQMVNVDATKRLLEQSIKANVKKFIFMSSVKVYGEGPFTEVLDETSQVGVNCDYYGLSKLAAEALVINLCEQNSIEFVIIRSPLVYGAKVKANFKALIKLAKTGLPLPFSGIKNKRSMIAIDNLTDFISCCITNKKAANQIYVISDDDDISLPRLIILLREAMGVSSRLFYFPFILMQAFTFLINKNTQFKKMTGTFQISPLKAKNHLDWKPIVSVDDAIKASTVEAKSITVGESIK